MKYKVAVYGSLRRGAGNSSLLKSARYVGKTVLPPHYTMYSLGPFPGVVKGGHTPIIVEIYEVEDHILARLDTLEGYGGKDYDNFYNRECINTNYGYCYIYLINRRYRNRDYPKVITGDWMKYIKKENDSTNQD